MELQLSARRGGLRACWLAGTALGAVAGMPTSARAQETTTYSYDALGRLASTSNSGGPNSGVVMGTCFDPAGNRTQYVVGTAGAPCTTPAPSPTPTPTPTNQAPVAVADSTSFHCSLVKSVSVLANDYDPDNNVPLSITSVTSSDPGSMWAWISGTSVQIAANAPGTYSLTYTIVDSLGSIGSGTVSMTVTGNISVCQEGPPV